MRWSKCCVVALMAAEGCGDDVAGSGGGSAEGSDVSASGSGSGSSGETGVPSGEGGARVLYFTRTGYAQGATDLFFVDCSGEVPAPPVQVNEPLAPDEEIYVDVPMLSPQRRWLAYDVSRLARGERWFVRIDGPTIGPPRRVELAPAERLQRPVFGGADERVAAFRVQHDETSAAMWLCRLADDGSCVPTQWSPPLARNPDVGGFDEALSPDGEWLAYVGDPDRDGTNDMLLARTEADKAGAFFQVSALPAGAYLWNPEFTAQSDTLYYTTRDPGSDTEDLFGVDLTVEPPGAPVLLTPTGATRIAFNAERSAFLQWAGGNQELVALTGTIAAPPVRLNAPEQAAGLFSTWVKQDQAVVFLAAKPGDPGHEEVFLVDVGGLVPSAPERLGEPLPMGAGVEDLPVFRDDERIFYSVSDKASGNDAFWAGELTGTAAAFDLSASLPAAWDALSFPAIAEGHDRVAFTLDPDEGPRVGYYVELGGGMVPVELGEGVMLWPGGDFSEDGSRLFYIRGGEAFQLDLNPSLGEPVRISDPAHGDGSLRLIVLPPA